MKGKTAETPSGCGMEFPYFGASYPDAVCIDGWLWDLDSYDGNGLTVGGDEECPFCNTEAWLESVVGTRFATREDALGWVKSMKRKYGRAKRR